MVSPYPQQFYPASRSTSRQDHQGSSNLNRQQGLCECCKGPIGKPALLTLRPLSGLSHTPQSHQLKLERQTVTPSNYPSNTDNNTSTKIGGGPDSASNSNNQILCLECQERFLLQSQASHHQNDIAGRGLSSDMLTVSHLASSVGFPPGTHQPTDPRKLNNQDHHPLFGENQHQSYLNQKLHNLKMTSSLMSSSHDLQSSNLTQQSNETPLQGLQANQLVMGDSKKQPFNYGQASALQNSSQQYQLHQQSQQSASSLQFLSKISSEIIGSSIKHHSEILSQRPQVLSSNDHYKVRLKGYMDRQIERAAKCASGQENQSSNMQFSRIFREKQSRRMFDQIQKM